MTRTFVFTGPSLDGREVRALAPDAVVLPPVGHGDLLACGARPGDRVAILDGVFFQSASVRHKEICALIEQGVAVHGAAGMAPARGRTRTVRHGRVRGCPTPVCSGAACWNATTRSPWRTPVPSRGGAP
ncbi:hypothetical protein BJF79_23655 [Actinomadura sp. CNU-125]|uniref:TfuA-like protein n=1 Tax=Actinomadura sp. CNU-125 TaxID=1904961 RepID=UPI0009608217|nr:TfuA-like protein [Actinomadura sp. CNU-125]OLT11720.1 hypothetical protein BJF79_23655 [Actinomadura sp. CNU-125]